MASFDSDTINFVIVTTLLAFSFAMLGALMVGAGYVKRKQKFVTGALIGAVMGLSIILIIMGVFGIAASNTYETSTRLMGIVMVGIGLLLFLMLGIFGPKRENTLGASSSGLLNLLKPSASGNSGNLGQAGKQPLNVFISYRRDDSPDVTGRIYDVLVHRYGQKSVFKDVDSIPFGVDFRQHIQNVIIQCHVVLVIIGDRWLSVADTEGAPRLHNQVDFVRIEIESALQRDIPIVPILVKGSAMPKDDDLPDSIRPLAYRNGIAVRYDPDFHHDMERLIRSLDGN